MGRKERWYFGFGVFVIGCGMVIAHTAPAALATFSALVGSIAVPLYGGALGKLWVETRNGGSGSAPSASR